MSRVYGGTTSPSSCREGMVTGTSAASDSAALPTPGSDMWEAYEASVPPYDMAGGNAGGRGGAWRSIGAAGPDHFQAR